MNSLVVDDIKESVKGMLNFAFSPRFTTMVKWRTLNNNVGLCHSLTVRAVVGKCSSLYDI